MSLVRQVPAVSWHRIIVIFLALWLLVVLLLAAYPGINSSSNVDSKSTERLLRALSDLDSLRRQNEELRDIFREVSFK